MQKKISLILIGTVSLILSACSSVPMDDFFGIQMPPEDADKFKIVSYSESEGVKYASTFSMNPRVYAYAEMRVEEILIKVVNASDDTLKSNYNQDEFYLYDKDGETYALLKGDREDYPQKKYIAPGEERQFKLYLPKNFWETLGMTRPFKNYTYEMWGGSNNLSFYKENVKGLKVVLGGKTVIILKPIPEKAS